MNPDLGHRRIRWFAAYALGLAGVGATILPHNSEEHKLLADRGASLVDPGAAEEFLVYPTHFLDLPASDVLLQYRRAKRLAVGVGPSYPTSANYVQDNAYWRGYGQRVGNLAVDVPVDNQLIMPPTRTLLVEGWTNKQEFFTFGELVALYGDYRRTVFCNPARPNVCYLTDLDDPRYDRPGKSDAEYSPGTTHFEYGNAISVKTPPPMPTATYLKYIASGLLPPHATDWRAIVFAAYPQEALDAGWWGDEMLRIAAVNDWHFSQAAVAWYVGMHRLALHYGVLARDNPAFWTQALHYEANGLHSLTDLFAFGHVVANRDRTAWDFQNEVTGGNLLTRNWMELALAMGGGRRDAQGMITFTASPDPVAPPRSPGRNDFQELCRTKVACKGYADRGVNEKDLIHGRFNTSGAWVVNLKGERFQIFGDGYIEKINSAPPGMIPAARVVEETVRASLQSLFDAFNSGKTADEIDFRGSEFYAALTNIPVYVEYNRDGLFNGRWTRYAAALDTVTGSGVVTDGCVMDYYDGLQLPPQSDEGAVCTAFPR